MSFKFRQSRQHFPRHSHPTCFFCILFSFLFINSCGPLPKEGPAEWVEVSLQLQNQDTAGRKRIGTETRGSELAIVFPASTQFSAKGLDPSVALGWKKVDTFNNTVSLSLPVEDRLRLFIYRYTENYSPFQFEELIQSRSLHLNAIDFGQSDIFAVPSDRDYIIVDGQRTLMLTIQLARQLLGKLAQSYVKGAQVWADRIQFDGSFNQQLDEDEDSTTSGANGDYQLSPDYHDYVLATKGGLKLNASGSYVPAAPMLATIPETMEDQVNITPLTTLVTYAPELENIFAQSGDWRADIASSNGVSGELLRIAKTAEAFWTLLASGSNPVSQTTQQQLSALNVLAQSLAQGGSKSVLEDLPELVSQSLDEALSNPAISRELSDNSRNLLNTQLTQLAENLTELLPNNDQVVEQSLLEEFDFLHQEAFVATQTIFCESSEGLSILFDPVISSISLVPKSENTITVRGTISDDRFDSLNAYWVIDPPNEFENMLDPILLEGTVDSSGFVENSLIINNWAHLGSIKLQLSECNPFNTISKSCDWVPNSLQVLCGF